jgi:hypothetical protein
MSKVAILVVGVGLATGLMGFVFGKSSTPSGGGDPAAVLAAIEQQNETIEALRSDVKDLRKQLDRKLRTLDRRIDESPAAAGARSAALEAAIASGEVSEELVAELSEGLAAAGGDELAARLEKRMGEQMERLSARQRNRDEKGNWKPPMSDLARELELDEQQAQDVTRVIDAGRDRAFLIIQTPRDDGTTLLEEFAEDLKQGDQGAATMRFFGRLANEKIPGSDSTYMARLGELNGEIDRELGEVMSAEQHKRMHELQVELLEVKTGYDPFGAFVVERLGE